MNIKVKITVETDNDAVHDHIVDAIDTAMRDELVANPIKNIGGVLEYEVEVEDEEEEE